MGKRRSQICSWPLLLAEAAVLAYPFAARADEAGSMRRSSAYARSAELPRLSEVSEMPLYLETSVNGRDWGLAGFTLRGDEIWTTRGGLERIGLTLHEDRPGAIRLSDIAGLQFAYDQAGQTLTIKAPVALLTQEPSRIGHRIPGASRPTSGTGFVYNYNVFGGISGETRTASAFSELRAFSRLGVVSSTFLTQALGARGDWSVDTVRLDTSASVSFPDKMLTVAAGDGLTAATPWSRATRFGGLQVGTNFALRPYEVTTPLTQFFGEAALPSTVELYVDGLKQVTGEVPPGQFHIETPAGTSGARSGQVVITDALGQVSTLSFDLYHAPALLRRGLSDWSVEAGFLRREYGLRSFDYATDPFASGTIRRGLTDRLTLEGHGEFTRQLVQGGVGAVWRAGQLGVVSGSISTSTAGGSSGTRYALGYSWSDRETSVSVNFAKASPGFRDLAALEGSPIPVRSISAQASHSDRTLGTFGFGYIDLDFGGEVHSRYLSAYWFKSLGRTIGLNVHATQDLLDSRNRAVFATLSMRLGDRSLVNESLQRDRNATFASLDAMRSIPDAGGFGWRAQVQRAGESLSAAGEVQYLGSHGQLIAGGRVAGGRLNAYAGMSGALIVMDGTVFVSREVDDGFAVVSTGGIAGVPVTLRNNVVGATGANGKLLVSGLNAYEDNLIGIDVLALPADVRVGDVEAVVTPADRSGTVVSFELAQVRAATLILIDEAGAPLPVGSSARVRGRDGSSAIVGFDGEVYLEALDDSNIVEVEAAGKSCAARFDYPRTGDLLPRIGPLTCSAKGSDS